MSPPDFGPQVPTKKPPVDNPPILGRLFDASRPLVPLRAVPPVERPPVPPDYIPPPVIPSARPQATVGELPYPSDVALKEKPGFIEGIIINQVATAGGKGSIVIPSTLAAKALPKVITPLPAGVGGFKGFLLGLPGGMAGAAIATSAEAGTGEEVDLNRAASAAVLAREAARGQVLPLTPTELADVKSLLQSGVVVGAFQSTFNAEAASNARTLAAGLAADAARAIVGGDLVAVAGGQAVARRESFVAGLLGLMLPNDNVGGVVLWSPSPQRGDP